MKQNDKPQIQQQNIRQLTTFTLGSNKYGIDVMRVQEVTNSLPVTKIPLAPHYVLGLINLRGQIAIAVGLSELFGIAETKKITTNMTVICRIDGSLLSLFVDSIGDVIEIPETEYEPVPDTIKGPIRKFMSGVFKTKDSIISIIDLDKMTKELNQNLEN